MAFSSNLNSRSNQSCLSLQRQYMSGQFHTPNSNIILGDHINQNFFANSQPNHFKPTMAFHQTKQFVRDTCLVPQRIQLVQTLNIDYFPLPNESMSSLIGHLDGQVCVTQVLRTREVVRTQLNNSVSTREPFLVPNHNFGAWIKQDQTHLQNQTNHSTFTEKQSFNQVPDPQLLNVPFSPGAKKPNPTQNEEYNQIFHDQGNNNISEAYCENKVDGDGRTHSLPYKKYGPYTCPKCKGVFMTSQTFAAHMGSHYKNESAEQRRKRHLAKYGKKHLRLVKPKDKLDIVPNKPFKKRTLEIEHRKNGVRVGVNVESDAESNKNTGKEIFVAHAFGGQKLEGLFDFPIKEEPREMIS